MYKYLLKFLRIIPKHDNELKFVMGGLKDSGKSSILYQLADNTYTVTIPTSGFNKAKFFYEDSRIQLWDLGCSDKYKEFFWKHLSIGSNGIIYVVDISEPDDLKSSAEEFKRILSVETLQGLPILIYGNKSDMKELSPEKVMKELGKTDISNRPWNYVETDAVSRKGIDSGFKWLLASANKNIVNKNS